MNLEKILKYFFETSHLPLTVYDESNAVKEFCVRRFEPDLALYCVRPVLGGKPVRSMDLTIDRNGIICGFVRDQKSGFLVIAGPVLEFLKNEDHILPLKKGSRIVVIGELAERPLFTGGGSSSLTPKQSDYPLEFLKKQSDVRYAKGCREQETDEAQPALVHALAKVSSRLVIIAQCGSAVEYRQIETEIKAILHTWIPGEGFGKAVTNLLFGDTYGVWKEHPFYGMFHGASIYQAAEILSYMGVEAQKAAELMEDLVKEDRGSRRK